jgi:hypothetical protein
MNRKWGRDRFSIKLLAIFPVMIGLLSLAVMLLWNAILPAVLHVAPINYWQAAGLLILSKILFSGFGFKNRSGRGTPYMREKFMSMTAEERAKWKAEWKRRCEQRRPDQ